MFIDSQIRLPERGLAACLLVFAAPLAAQSVPASLAAVDSSRRSAEGEASRRNCLNGVASGVTSLDGLRVSGAPATRRQLVDEDGATARRDAGPTGVAAGRDDFDNDVIGLAVRVDL